MVMLLATPASSRGAGPASRGSDATYWVVFRDGQRVAARGELEVRPGMAWFHDLSGRLLSTRLEFLDLEATSRGRGERALPSPATARNVEIAEPLSLNGEIAGPPLPNPVGLAGESAKRAGHLGTFTDLSGVVTALPETAQATKPSRRSKKRGAAPGAPTAGAGPPRPPPARP